MKDEDAAHVLTMALKEIQQDWFNISVQQFGGGMRMPTFRVTESTAHLGRWVSAPRCMEMSSRLLLEHPWAVVTEVLRHEMAHQYVDEVLGLHGEAAHGPAFQRVCAERGIDPRASGIPVTAADERTTRVLDRVRKLLALAQSPQQHEAESAMRAARKLMHQHSLDDLARAAERSFVFRQVGRATSRFQAHELLVGAILERHFLVKVLIIQVFDVATARRCQALEISGTPANVAMAEYVHAFLLRTAEGLWNSHKRMKAIRGNGPRRSYLEGVMHGFLKKLDEDRATEPALALVKLDDPALEEWHAQRHPSVRRRGGGGRPVNDAFMQGHEAGRKLVLHRPVEGGPSEGTPRRLGPAGGT